LGQLVAAYREASLEERFDIADRIFIDVHPYLAWFLSRSCPEEAVQDLVQETGIAIARKLHTCSHTTDHGVRSWCLGIARHKRADYFRDKHVQRAGLFDRDAYDTLVDFSVEDRRIEAEERELLDLALDLLSVAAPDDLELLLLHYIEGFNYAELALLMGSTKEAVRMKVVRARQKAAKLVKSKVKND
jgi:RNA polymerase sigma factor (sigma-70 family)